MILIMSRVMEEVLIVIESRQDLKTRHGELIVEHSPKSPVSEAYRNLRTNLSFLRPDNPLTKIAVTSSGPKEGKSLTVANLAISMAHNEQEVLIIDADLRKPMQHKFYELPNYEGLSNILTGELKFREAVQASGIEGLNVISTGVIPPNPSELLSSQRMEEVIAKAEEEFDFVIIDTPPIIAVTDAAILGKKLDGVLLVVASHQTKRVMLEKSTDKLRKANIDLIGTVLNKHPVQEYDAYYYYYGE